jgi:hypothetical protein
LLPRGRSRRRRASRTNLCSCGWRRGSSRGAEQAAAAPSLSSSLPSLSPPPARDRCCAAPGELAEQRQDGHDRSALWSDLADGQHWTGSGATVWHWRCRHAVVHDQRHGQKVSRESLPFPISPLPLSLL